MKRSILTLILALFAVSFTASAATPFNIKYGPWVTNVSSDGFNVLWVTDFRCISFVEVAPEDGSAFNAAKRPRFYQTFAGRSIPGFMHNVRVSGLKPGTVYRYRMFIQEIKDDSKPYDVIYGSTMRTTKNYWEDFSVKTLDSQAGSCKFTMINDMHFLWDKYAKLLEGKTAADMDFLLLNGDIVSHSDNIDSVIKYTFMPAQQLLTTVPVVYARGNHESRGKDFDKVGQLTPTSTGEFYFTFRQGPVAFVVLDASEDKPDQSVEYFGYAHYDDYRAAELEWLKNAVKEPEFAKAPIKIAIMHIPPRVDKGSWYTERWCAENFVPVLNKAGVDVMLSAHKHKYIWYDKGSCGNNFPILVNSNVDRLDVSADKSGITLKIFDINGNEIHSHHIKK